MNNWNRDTVVEDVNINYFDISPQSLKAREWMHKEWNPQNFDEYLDYLYEEWYQPDKALISIYEDFDFLSPTGNQKENKQKRHTKIVF